jgi:hypothetical protein
VPRFLALYLHKKLIFRYLNVLILAFATESYKYNAKIKCLTNLGLVPIVERLMPEILYYHE